MIKQKWVFWGKLVAACFLCFFSLVCKQRQVKQTSKTYGDDTSQGSGTVDQETIQLAAETKELEKTKIEMSESLVKLVKSIDDLNKRLKDNETINIEQFEQFEREIDAVKQEKTQIEQQLSALKREIIRREIQISTKIGCPFYSPEKEYCECSLPYRIVDGSGKEKQNKQLKYYRSPVKSVTNGSSSDNIVLMHLRHAWKQASFALENDLNSECTKNSDRYSECGSVGPTICRGIPTRQIFGVGGYIYGKKPELILFHTICAKIWFLVSNDKQSGYGNGWDYGITTVVGKNVPNSEWLAKDRVKSLWQEQCDTEAKDRADEKNNIKWQCERDTLDGTNRVPNSDVQCLTYFDDFDEYPFPQKPQINYQKFPPPPDGEIEKIILDSETVFIER